MGAGVGAEGAAAAEGEPLRRLASPSRLPYFCLRCFSACNSFSRRVCADGAALSIRVGADEAVFIISIVIIDADADTDAAAADADATEHQDTRRGIQKAS